MLAAAREDSDDEVGERGMEAMISGGGEGRARKFKNSLFLHLIIVNPFFLLLSLSLLRLIPRRSFASILDWGVREEKDE